MTESLIDELFKEFTFSTFVISKNIEIKSNLTVG